VEWSGKEKDGAAVVLRTFKVLNERGCGLEITTGERSALLIAMRELDQAVWGTCQPKFTFYGTQLLDK